MAIELGFLHYLINNPLMIWLTKFQNETNRGSKVKVKLSLGFPHPYDG